MQKKLLGGLAHDLPDDLANALAQTKEIIALWQSLTPIGRNEFICWVEDAKRDNTRARRIERSVEQLRAGEKRPCCWAGCIHRTDKPPSDWQQAVLIDKKPRNRGVQDQDRLSDVAVLPPART
jgi:hypothetical protein